MKRTAREIDLEALCDQAEEGYLIPCRREDGTADLHARASNGDTLLHVAVGRRNFSEIRYLVDAGLDVNARGDYYQTPLASAAWKPDPGVFGFLLKMGADPSIPDYRGVLLATVLFEKLQQLTDPDLERLSGCRETG